MTSAGDDPASPLRSCEQFEILVSELLTHFVELPAGKVDAAITAAQQRVCEQLGVDLSALWQWTPGSRRYLTLTHLHRPPGGSPVPERVDANELFPWTLRETLAGRSCIFSSFDELPPEAAGDLGTRDRFGVLSAVIVPLSTGGGPVLGAASFATVNRERTWPPDVVRRLQLVARIFAGALGRKAADEALRESEERLQLAAEAAGIGLWRLDLATSTFWVTDQARRHFDFPDETPLTLEDVLARVRPEDRGRILAAVESARQSGSLEVVDYVLLLPGGGERWLSSRGRTRPGPSGEPGSLMGVTLNVTDRKQAELTSHDLSRRLIRAHEEERALLARDLHDDLSQRLAVLSIDAGRAELSAPDGPHAPTLRAIREGLVDLSEDVHTLACQLHPSVLEELGLTEALRTECERFQRQVGIEVSAHFDPLTRTAGPEEALCLFRVAQEALRNVARHAAARSVTVTLQQRDGGLALTVRDDGAGFDPTLQRERRSLGLASMRERVQLVAGELGVCSATGEGTTITAWVPAERAAR